MYIDQTKYLSYHVRSLQVVDLEILGEGLNSPLGDINDNDMQEELKNH